MINDNQNIPDITLLWHLAKQLPANHNLQYDICYLHRAIQRMCICQTKHRRQDSRRHQAEYLQRSIVYETSSNYLQDKKATKRVDVNTP